MSEWVSTVRWACHALFCTDMLFLVGVTTPLPCPRTPQTLSAGEGLDIRSDVRHIFAYPDRTCPISEDFEVSNVIIMRTYWDNRETRKPDQPTISGTWNFVGANSSVQIFSELGSETWSCCKRDTYHLSLFVDLRIFLERVFGHLWYFFHDFEGSQVSLVLTSGSVTHFEKACIWGLWFSHPLCRLVRIYWQQRIKSYILNSKQSSGNIIMHSLHSSLLI